ncbi:MAG: hypothetical protein KC944_06605 [Candidatus Omnitrophica bacterium]|nr:hypothetical protein [Candidatus Omnitrophota bacterium]
MDNSTQDILVACGAPVIFWTLAYLTWTRRIGKDADSVYRDVLKMSEDQIDAMNKMGAVFVALIGTIPPVVMLFPVGWGRQMLVAVFLVALLVSPAILYRMRPPEPVSDEPVSARGFFFKNVPRVISLIIFVFAAIAPLFLYYQGPHNLSFAAMGFMMGLFVALAYFFVSLY